ncbi:MAG TPA: hypothetical protein VFU36_11895 [Jatrophihabitans sp.]|nr:hypothetical protein [Jatrophihabitans sp.]
MLSSLASQRTSALRRAAVRATLAPSVHNSQPWRLHLAEDRLDLHADLARQLAVLDPTARQLYISCGCALLNARVALAGEGCGIRVERFPRMPRTGYVASLTPTDEPADLALAALDPVIELRQTNRGQFADEAVPEPVLAMLAAAAAAESASLHLIHDAKLKLAVARLSQRADAIENLNPAYRAELRAWTTDDPARGDGVADGTVAATPIPPLAPPGKTSRSATRLVRNQTLALLCTDGDSLLDWLRAGEALERVLLEITRHGLAAGLLTEITEVPSTRAELRHELALAGYPHVLMRVGRAPVVPASRRRRLVDVLTEEN